MTMLFQKQESNEDSRSNGRFKKTNVALAILLVMGVCVNALLFRSTTKQLSRSIATTTNEQEKQQTTRVDDKDPYFWNGTATFRHVATSLTPVTDKVTSHKYHIMYGQFLLPYYRKNPQMKMLEIGLGCDMGYGPGASVALYKELFPEADLWEAEFNEACVEKYKTKDAFQGIRVLTGDQGNATVLDRWIQESGGNFDVVIDDGGHHQCQIWTSFLKLWPTLKPGGLYFIEDLQVARHKNYNRAHSSICDAGLNVPDKLKESIDQLMYRNRQTDIKFVHCQAEACLVGKKD